MPFSIPHLVERRRNRRHREARAPRSRLARLAWAVLAVLSLLVALALVPAALAYSNLTQGLPTVESLPLLLDPPSGYLLKPTRLYDRTGTRVLLTLQNPAVTARRYLTYDALPPGLVDATVAFADPGFWDHPGFASLTSEDSPSLAEQLASELLLWPEPPSLSRTLRQKLLAAQITSAYGRQKVLEWYLNTADFGHLAFGIDAAAQVYFGKTAESLTIAESALLVAVSEAPDLNPIDAPQLALERQRAVLEALVSEGYLTPQQAQTANSVPLQVQSPALAPDDPYPAFTALVLDQLAAHFGAARVRRGGLLVTTTLDLDLQTQAACAASAQIARLTSGASLTELLADPNCPAARLLPTLASQDAIASPGLSAEVVALDPVTGQILALVGSSSRLGSHTPGSLLTPFVYLTAFARGLSPASLVWDIPANLPSSLPDYTNSDGEFHGPMSIRAALANDYLVPAFQTLDQIGPANAWLTASQSGFASLGSPLGDDAYHLLLDQGAVSLLESAHAYSLFANNGILAGQALGASGDFAPSTVLTVKDYSGRLLLDWSQPQLRSVTTAQLAYLVTDVLADELARRPSLGHPNPLEIGRPAAAKLGRTSDGRGAWTMGFTPQLLVGIWLGDPDPASATQISPLAAAGLWNAVTKYALADLPVVDFELPIGLSRIEVCVPSGLLPTPECPEVASEVFLPGSEPMHPDNLYRVFEINRQTGRLATIFTPPELVEEQVFLVVPPEALDWARDAGLPIPPEDYDVVFVPTEINPDVNISSPAMFAYVGGQLQITGSAGGEGFQYYRVQVGEGLNPRQWLQIGEDNTTPVTDGLLATWDTGDLSGLFAIQLLVVRQDRSVETTAVQVTVDNQPPDLQILFPAPGQIFSYPLPGPLTFQIQAADNLGIARLEYYLDGKLLASQTQPPFAFPWQATLGDHTLLLIAIDLAGNRAEVSVTFSLAR